MSLKENIDYVKEELSAEEKFLEGTIKAENFFKKNKFLIIASILVVVGLVVGISVKKSLDESKKLEANIAFNKILENPKDTDALKTLKNSNPKLYEIAEYLNAKKEGEVKKVDIDYLNSLSKYLLALKNNSGDELNTLSMNNKFLLKEFALFNRALILTKNGKFEEAKNVLKMIPTDSRVNELANLLNHHLATK